MITQSQMAIALEEQMKKIAGEHHRCKYARRWKMSINGPKVIIVDGDIEVKMMAEEELKEGVPITNTPITEREVRLDFNVAVWHPLIRKHIDVAYGVDLEAGVLIWYCEDYDLYIKDYE